MTAPAGDKYDSSKEWRTVVPLKDLTAWLEFRSAGANRIWGFIEWDTVRGTKGVKNDWMTRYDRSGSFRRTILLYSGDDYNNPDARYQSAPISVEVPAEAFAAPPSQWELTWCNWLFGDQALDQCAFRRRRLFAYGVQPFLFFFNYLFRMLMTLAALLIVSRGFSLQPLLHPLRDDMSDLWNIFGGRSWFFQPEKKARLAIPIFLCMPVISIPIIVGIWLLVHFNLLASVVIAILVIVPMCLLIMWGTIVLGKRLERRIEKQNQLPAWYLQQEEMNLIVCSGRKKPFELSELPKSHRTIRLRFQELKSRVCRPFSA
jgi:hypothetical protein